MTHWPDDVREAPSNTRVAEEGVELAESIAVKLEQGELRHEPLGCDPRPSNAREPVRTIRAEGSAPG